MRPLEMITEWRRGCSNAGDRQCPAPKEPTSPAECVPCTVGLIDAMEKALKAERFLIWSNEHGAWWRPGSAGYTIHAEAAGRYSHAEALAISAGARDGWRPGQAPPEIPVAEADVLACEERGLRPVPPHIEDRPAIDLATGLREDDLP